MTRRRAAAAVMVVGALGVGACRSAAHSPDPTIARGEISHLMVKATTARYRVVYARNRVKAAVIAQDPPKGSLVALGPTRSSAYRLPGGVTHCTGSGATAVCQQDPAATASLSEAVILKS